MRFDCTDNGAFTVIAVTVVSAIAFAFVVFSHGEAKVKVECYKTAAAAVAASSPHVPVCKQ